MKTVFKDLLGKGLVYGLGSSLNGLVGFILIPFFINHLRADEYGRFALAEMLLNLLVVIMGLGLNIALLSRYPCTTPEKRSEIISNLFGMILFSTFCIEFIVTLFYFLAGNIIFLRLNSEMFLLVIAISAIETVWLLFSTLYRAEGSAWMFIIASLLQLFIGLIVTIWMIVGLGFRSEGILYGRLIGNVFLLGILSPKMLKYHPKFNMNIVRQMLKIGLPLVPVTFASMWVSMSPRYFIELFGTPNDVGIFAMSSKISSIISLVFIQPFAMTWSVVMFRVYQRVDAQIIYARVLTYYILIGGTLALSLGILAPQIVFLLGKVSFPLSTDVILFMAISCIISGLMYPITIGPYVSEATHTVLPIFLISTLVAMGSLYLMTSLWGLRGACIALILVYFVQTILLRRLSNSLYQFPLEIKRISKAIIALIIAYFFTINLSLLKDGISSFLLLLIFILIEITVLISLGFFGEDEKHLIISILNYQNRRNS